MVRHSTFDTSDNLFLNDKALITNLIAILLKHFVSIMY